jgi:hypothetical protein
MKSNECLGTVLTAAPMRWSEGRYALNDTNKRATPPETEKRATPPNTEERATLLDIIRITSKDNSTWKDSSSLIEHILMQCVRFPDEFERAGVGYHVLAIFESWIANLVGLKINDGP